jgi:hypothetical protein
MFGSYSYLPDGRRLFLPVRCPAIVRLYFTILFIN